MCTADQVQDEVAGCLDLGFEIYRLFGLEPELELSTRPENRLGDDALWDRAEGELTRALESRGVAIQGQRGRRGLLRPEDRPPHDRRDRPVVAARHRPARLREPRALRHDLHGRRQRRAPAGGHPSRADGHVRAVHRHPHRALRRRLPGLADAGPGDRAADLRSPGRRCRRRARDAAGGGVSGPSSTIGPSRSGGRSATPSCARSPTCSSSATARPPTGRSRSAPATAATSAASPVAELAERVVGESRERSA